jgi:cation-transporting ATPase E
MASGSDAAKNVSSLVLLDSNFASMPKVVEEGRRSINNLERSASLYLMKTLYNTMLAVLFMIVPFDLPFEPRHLTLISSVTIGIPSVVLALEPNKDRVSGHFLPKVLSHALPGSITVVLGAVAVIITNACFLKDLRLEQVQSLYLVLTTFVGLMYLFKVSMPFNWIHVLNFVAMIGIYVAFYFIDLGFFSTIEYFGLDKDFTMDMIYAIPAIGAVLLVAFVGLLFATKGVNKKEDSVLVKLLKKANVI